MKGLLVFAAVLALAVAAPKARSPKPQPDSRIVGGVPIDISQRPIQTALLFLGNLICGGVIVSPTWVVTAGHCADGTNANFVTFRAGSTFHASGGQVVSAANVAVHPLYDSWDIDYDIAVYALATSLSFGSSIAGAVLPYQGQDWAHGSPSVITGWGTTSEGGSLSPNLQSVSVPVVGLPQCRAAYGASAVTERMLCAGVPEGGLDACQGDSGGPLTVNGVLAGLVSWGYGCARPNFPGVYSHVGALVGFITEQTGLS